MSALNFNALYCVDNSTVTNQILREIKHYVGRAKDQGETITVSLMKEDEMRSFCNTRRVAFQPAILINRYNVVIEEPLIVSTVRTYSMPSLQNYKLPQRSLPHQITDDNRNGAPSIGINQSSDSRVSDSDGSFTRGQENLSTMNVGPSGITTSPARLVETKVTQLNTNDMITSGFASMMRVNQEAQVIKLDKH